MDGQIAVCEGRLQIFLFLIFLGALQVKLAALFPFVCSDAVTNVYVAMAEVANLFMFDWAIFSPTTPWAKLAAT